MLGVARINQGLICQSSYNYRECLCYTINLLSWKPHTMLTIEHGVCKEESNVVYVF